MNIQAKKYYNVHLYYVTKLSQLKLYAETVNLHTKNYSFVEETQLPLEVTEAAHSLDFFKYMC